MHPLAIEALGDLGEGLTTEVWWSPSHPFTSSLTKQSAKALAESYEATTRKQWTQPIGFSHALFEVASDALKRSKSLKPGDVRDAVAASKFVETWEVEAGLMTYAQAVAALGLPQAIQMAGFEEDFGRPPRSLRATFTGSAFFTASSASMPVMS